MKKVILLFLLTLISSICFGADLADRDVTVVKIHDGWDIDKVYVLNDTKRGKWCYVVSTNGAVGIQCFNIKGENK